MMYNNSFIQKLGIEMAYVYGKWAVNKYDTTPLTEDGIPFRNEVIEMAKDEFIRRFKYNPEVFENKKPWEKTIGA